MEKIKQLVKENMKDYEYFEEAGKLASQML